MKKRKRYLIAGLAIIAVTASSTLAYFTSTATIGNTGGAGNPLALNITNGKVEITANPGAGGSSPNWSYDVARFSNTNYKPYFDGGPTAGTDIGGYTTDGGTVASNITKFENKHRSIDMKGLGTTNTNTAAIEPTYSSEVNPETFRRWNIGAPVIGDITFARPGDAFVMGLAAAGGTDTGLVIKNNSNLTVRVQLNAIASATYAALVAGGWKLYVGGTKADNSIISISEITSLTDLQTKLNLILPTTDTLISGGSINLNVRLELPLTAGNTLQYTTGPAGIVSGFNLNSLFTITATQENNPGWTQ